MVFVSGTDARKHIRLEIPASVNRELTGYKVPKQFEFRDSLPKTLVGKSTAERIASKYSAD